MRSFRHPMEGTYDFEKEVELQIQIGSKRYPGYPIRSLAEAYYQLRKTLSVFTFQMILSIFVNMTTRKSLLLWQLIWKKYSGLPLPGQARWAATF